MLDHEEIFTHFRVRIFYSFPCPYVFMVTDTQGTGVLAPYLSFHGPAHTHAQGTSVLAAVQKLGPAGLYLGSSAR